MIPANNLLENLSYNRTDGTFTWINSRGGRVIAGCQAGSLNGQGRIYIGINGKRYQLHRLVWLAEFGEFPTNQIDHIDGDPLNNVVSNLREATHAENKRNSKVRKDSGSGVKGVRWHIQTKKWHATLRFNGKQHSLGLHETKEAAHEAYCKAAKVFHGDFFHP